MTEGPRFLLDAMLVRLGKYLRCAGFDAEWDRAAGTRELARRAAAEGRVLVTRNTRLGEDVRPPPRYVVLRLDDPVGQLRGLAHACGLELRELAFTRCIRCNVELRDALPEEVAARVLPEVRARHRRFYTCPACATVFWRGTHVANTCARLGLRPPTE